MEEKLQKVAEDFLKRIQEKLPAEKADKPSIVGIVGMIGSGKTTFCRELVKHLKGAVLVSSNSARYLLKQEGMSWGDNVRESTFYVAKELIKEGYAVVFDGDHVDKQKRENTQRIVDELGIRFYLVRINILQQTAEKRIDAEDYNSHKQGFEDFWPDVDAEDAKNNLRVRISLYLEIDREEPKPEFFAEIENEGTIEEFKQKAIEVAKKIESQ